MDIAVVKKACKAGGVFGKTIESQSEKMLISEKDSVKFRTKKVFFEDS